MSDKQRLYYVGHCRICGTGPLGLRECGSCGSVVVLCDECDAVWVDENFSAKPRFSSGEDLLCPHCEQSLVEAPSRWATHVKINSTGWIQRALAAAKLELRRGWALSPMVDENPTPGDPPIPEDPPPEGQSPKS